MSPDLICLVKLKLFALQFIMENFRGVYIRLDYVALQGKGGSRDPPHEVPRSVT